MENDTATKRKKPEWFQEYRIIGRIGGGRYGDVYLAKSLSPDTFCKPLSFKRFKLINDGNGVPPSIVSQLMLLRDEISHQNFIKVLNVHTDDSDMNTLYLISEYAHYDLDDITRHHKKFRETQPLDQFKVKSILWQLLKGIAYLHSKSLVHRDVKPSNVLIMDGLHDEGVVKISDYGLATVFDAPMDPLFKIKVSRRYYAPELLLGEEDYTTAVDIWAIGCIFAELLILNPLFDGMVAENSECVGQPDLLYKIFMILGTPTVDKWPTFTDLPHWKGRILGFKFHGSILARVVNLPQNDPAYDLLSKMLQYDPEKRIRAAQALEHEYFQIEPLPGHNTLVPHVKYPARIVILDWGTRAKTSPQTSQQQSNEEHTKLEIHLLPQDKKWQQTV